MSARLAPLASTGARKESTRATPSENDPSENSILENTIKRNRSLHVDMNFARRQAWSPAHTHLAENEAEGKHVRVLVVALALLNLRGQVRALVVLQGESAFQLKRGVRFFFLHNPRRTARSAEH